MPRVFVSTVLVAVLPFTETTSAWTLSPRVAWASSSLSATVTRDARSSWAPWATVFSFPSTADAIVGAWFSTERGCQPATLEKPPSTTFEIDDTSTPAILSAIVRTIVSSNLPCAYDFTVALSDFCDTHAAERLSRLTGISRTWPEVSV